ncbi:MULTISPECIES: alpha/beta hydrolase family protein [unclassified Spirosoma]|uniref:alpha/beta hydrolase n=1 Tax=unclassified Spirosoma TaxID=2621999 RepID=UPI00095A4F88|nr:MULTISPECIES: alpha/beta hydrolase family protein [unclassified Spirosoma]MBN8822924.1 esterase family protein [Spirosoma sp.]OJW80109.1 MAG: esterase [Spirosoma sp. 48-14]
MIKTLLFGLSLFATLSIRAAKVDSLDVPSTVMQKTMRAVVVLPESYAKSKANYPVLYLLHGGYGHFNDWITKTPDKNLIQRLADQYNLIIAMPEGEVFSYYLDSPVRKDSQFETYLTKEVIGKIDNTYRTIRDRKGRVITGLSMGGYGSLLLAAHHPDLYCAAGSMSGALNPDMQSWKLPPDMMNGIKLEFEKILGPIEQVPQTYAAFSVINLADKLKANGQNLIVDCGVDDFLIEPNRELHRRLVFNQTPHDYSERPGGHSWDYWQNSLPNHVLFFSNTLKANGSTAP